MILRVLYGFRWLRKWLLPQGHKGLALLLGILGDVDGPMTSLYWSTRP
jgi:hypothetical protein